MTYTPETVHTVSIRSVRSWFPQSWVAAVLFLLIAVVMAIPVLIAFFLAVVFYSECFMDCSVPDSDPGLAALSAGVGLVLLAMPFAGVRFYQGAHPASAPARLAVVAVPLAAIVLLTSFVWAPW